MYSVTASNTQTKKNMLSYYREERQKCDTIHETLGTVSVLPQLQAQRREWKYDTPKSKVFLTDPVTDCRLAVKLAIYACLTGKK